MRTTAPPVLPPLGLHAELDTLVEPLAAAYTKRTRLIDRTNQIEQETLDEATQADIDAARAASLGRATPPTSQRAHELVAEGLEVARDLAACNSTITADTAALHAALASHGPTWATEIERTALTRRTETFTAAVDAVAAADLDLQAARGLVTFLRDGEPLTPVLPGRCWPLMRPSGDPTTMTEVLDGLRRYATEAPPGPRGRLRFDMTGSRTA